MAAILLVVGNATTPDAADAAVKTRLEALGHTVTLHDDGTAAPNLAPFAAVVVGNASSSTAAAGLRTSALPMMVMSTFYWASAALGMVGTTGTGSTVTTVFITAPASPLAAGLAAGTQTLCTTAQGKGIATSITAAAPLNATVAGTNGSGGAATIFEFMPGEEMISGNSFAAPGYRLGWGYPAMLQATAGTNTNAVALFDAGIARTLAQGVVVATTPYTYLERRISDGALSPPKIANRPNA